MLLVGYLIVFCYVIVMIGRFNFVQQRFFLSLGGLLGVIMGIIVSYGVCSAIGKCFVNEVFKIIYNKLELQWHKGATLF